MRDIKFRAFVEHNGINKIMRVVGIGFDNRYTRVSDEQGEVFLKDKACIDQYTGLNDKNGTEIYEGDYLGVELEYDEFINPMCVGWNKDKHCWSLYINGCHEYDLDEFSEYEVIGNLHQGITREN